MAASVSQPIVSQCHYDPMFKVDVFLHAPLHEHIGSQHEHKLEMMALSLSLDSLIKQELVNHPDRQMEHGKASSAFTDKENNLSFTLAPKLLGLMKECAADPKALASVSLTPSSAAYKACVVASNMQQVLRKSNIPMNCDMYLRHSGLNQLFPRSTDYLADPDNCSMALKKTTFYNYMQQMSAMNHALNLARQINEDAIHSAKPKYLAHQIAVLYQSLNNIPSGSKLFSRHGKNIEANFQALKTSVSDLLDGESDSLVSEVRQWIIELTDNIIEIITSLPSSLTQEIVPVAQVMVC